MMNTVQYIFSWWLIFFLLGLLAYPITCQIFINFKDRGYAFTKYLALASISFFTLLLSLAKILPFGFPSLLISVAGLSLIALLFRKNYRSLYEQRFYILCDEIIFTLCFLLWVWIRSFQPDIHGLEKFMDFGFIQSILRENYLPPVDIWHFPQTINYYYFGHLMIASATKLSLVPSNISFNLMVATLVGLTASGSFSIGGNLQIFSTHLIKKKFILGGLISCILVCFVGNSHVIYAFLKQGSSTLAISSFPNGYFYAYASRFIEHTILEFPIYSATVSDLHPHYVDLPLVLLCIGFFLSQLTRVQPLTNKQLIYYLICSAFLLALIYMTNPIDMMIYFWIFLALTIYHFSRIDCSIKKKVRACCISIVCLIGLYFILTAPFRSTFSLFVNQIGIQCAPEAWDKMSIGPFVFDSQHCEHSTPWQLALAFGLPLYWGLLFLLLKMPLNRSLQKIKTNISAADWFILTIFIFSVLLIIAPELIYLKDIYPTHYRANTMFKLTYQAFVLLSLVSAYAIIKIPSQSNKTIGLKSLWVLGLFLQIIPATFPLLAIPTYYNNLTNQRGLDGTLFLKQLSESDYQAIQWLKMNVKEQKVILEALGRDYSDTSRVSTFTGIPTIEGWVEHEWLWRGDPEKLRQRKEDIKKLYESDDLNLTRQLLAHYQIDYIFIGKLEYRLYNINLKKFQLLGKVVFQNGGTKIYQINR